MTTTEVQRVGAVRPIESFVVRETGGVSIGADRWWDANLSTDTRVRKPLLDHRTARRDAPHRYEFATARPQNFVNGTVLGIGQHTIECELAIPGGLTRINLHRDLFPENVVVGMPFRLEVSEENGIRRPRIVPRSIAENPFPALRAEIEELMQDP